MRFQKDADVVDSNGKKIGEIARVVIDPNSGNVTHIVVRKGFFFPQDKVLPIDQLSTTGKSDAIYAASGVELDKLPDFIETSFIPLNADEINMRGFNQDEIDASPLYWYPGVGGTPMLMGGAWGIPTIPSTTNPPVAIPQENIPEGTVALKEGAEVLDPSDQKVGTVEKMITGGASGDQLTHLVVTKGGFDQRKKLIPANWIKAIKEDGVRLAVNAGMVENLKDYEE